MKFKDDYLEKLLSPENDTRKQAEKAIQEARMKNPQQLLQQLLYVATMTTDTTDSQYTSSLAALLIKNKFIEDREDEKGLWKLTNEHSEIAKRMMDSINF